MTKLSRDLLTTKEVEALMGACGTEPAGIRNKALIALLAATGIRISEALAVMPTDLRKRKLHIRRAKGGKERDVWVHPDAFGPIKAWKRIRKKQGLEDAPLFCSLEGATLSASYVRRQLPKLATAAEIEKRVYADGFRHVFAARAFEAKITPRSLQVQFGHDNIAATVAYLERIGLHSGFAEFDSAFA